MDDPVVCTQRIAPTSPNNKDETAVIAVNGYKTDIPRIPDFHPFKRLCYTQFSAERAFSTNKTIFTQHADASEANFYTL